MKAKQLIEEFERGKALAREATTQAEVVAIIDTLEALTLRHMAQNKRSDRWVRPVPPLPVVIDSDTRWG